MSYLMTTCPFCGCGCGLYLEVQGQRVIGVIPTPAHPVSQARLCVKGWHAHELVISPRRLHTPLIRQNGRLHEVSWNEALDLVAFQLNQIRKREGSNAVGVLGSARGTNEENYLLAKFARCCLGTNNVDFTDRLEALPVVFDLSQYRHLTTPGLALTELDHSDLIVIWQSDPSQEHPAVAARILRAVEQGAVLIEVGARRSQLSGLTHQHLFLRPSTDMYLVYGLLRAAFERKQPSTPAAEALAASVSDWTPERTEAVTGVSASLVDKIVEMFSRAKRPIIICTRATSVLQQAAELLNGLSALSWVSNGDSQSRSLLLWLGHYCNLQGARDMGVVPYFVTSNQTVVDKETRGKFSRSWGVDLPEASGLASWDMLGKVKGMLVMGDDPVARLPDAGKARADLKALEFLAVIDIFPTATTEMAHVILPGASFAEKDGTFTSADRRVQRVRQAALPAGAAKPEWKILCELSGRFGYAMNYDSPSEVMDEIAALTPTYNGLSFATLEESWGIKLPIADHLPQPELSGAEGEPHSNLYKGLPRPDAEFPLVLAVDYAHQAWVDDPMIRGTVTLCRELGADREHVLPIIEISSFDAQESNLKEGQRVKVRSRTGEVEAVVRVTEDISPGTVMLPFAVREMAARVMPPALHPENGFPMLPPCAVSISKA